MTQIIMSGDMGPQKGQAQAGKGAASTQTGALKAAVSAIAAKLELAWNKGDAAGFAAAFSDKADFVPMVGAHITGRDKIEAAHKALFGSSGGKTRAEYRILKLKPLTPEIVIAFLAQRLTSAGSEKAPAVRTRPTVVIRKFGQEWKIVSMQVTRVARVESEAEASASAATSDSKPDGKSEGKAAGSKAKAK